MAKKPVKNSRKHSARNKKTQKSFLERIPKPYLYGGIGGVAVLVIALIVLAVFLFAPEKPADDPYHFSGNMLAVKENGKWGYVDNTGTMAVPLIYDEAKPFGDNGLAAVKKDGLWGFINTAGEEVVNFVYEDTLGYSRGFAPVQHNGRWGYINEGGMNVIPNIYEFAGAFSENGLGLVKMNGLYGYLDTTGALKIPTQFTSASAFSDSGYAQVCQNGLYGFIDGQGSFAIQPQYNATGSGFYHNLAAVKTETGWGYVDSTGTVVVEPQYDFAGDFTADGIARVQKNGKYCFINTTGNYITESQFPYVSDFSGGFALVTQDGKQGLLKTDGTFAIAPGEKLLMQPVVEGLLPFQTPDGLFGYADTAGQTVVSSQYTAAKPFRNDGYAAVQKDGKWGLIDKTGTVILELKYDEIR